MQLGAVINWCQLHSRWLPVDDSVESVDGVSGILDGARRSVGLHQAVAALNDAPVSRFMLRLRVACQSVLDAVGKAVVRVGVGIDVAWRRVRVATVGGCDQEYGESHNLQIE